MPSENRQDEHVQTALTSLVECVPEFKDFPIDIQRKIIKRCELQEFEAGRVIIRQNHSADNFYFIVSGISKFFLMQFNLNKRPINKYTNFYFFYEFSRP